MSCARGGQHRLAAVNRLERELLHVEGQRNYRYVCRKCGKYLKNLKGEARVKTYYLFNQKSGQVRWSAPQKMPVEVAAEINADMRKEEKQLQWVSADELESLGKERK